MKPVALFLLGAVTALLSCSGPPCRSARDCPLGTYCQASASNSFGASGTCRLDCETAEDCAAPSDPTLRGVCTNEGRCRNDPIPPRLVLFEPEPGQSFELNERRVRITGEIESAAASVLVEASIENEMGCAGTTRAVVEVFNAEPGVLREVPFVIEDVLLGPGTNTLTVEARIGRSFRRRRVDVDVSCPNCPLIQFEPQVSSTGAGGQAVLRGAISPAVPVALWRVHSSAGDVFDGPVRLNAGGFAVDSVPLFARSNRIEVVASTGAGQVVCAQEVVSPDTQSAGLRAVALWDGMESDLDLHVIGPGGSFADPSTSLSARSLMPMFEGTVHDDSDGGGPEQVRVPEPPDGSYGIIVEPVFDGADPGSNARAWILFDGEAVHRGPLGPQFLTAFNAELWVLGVLVIEDGSASWRLINEVVPALMPPTAPPSSWPNFY